jgi:hypothetical protein
MFGAEVSPEDGESRFVRNLRNFGIFLNFICHEYFEVESRLILVRNSVRTTKKTPHFTITKNNWLTLFKEIIAVYTENYTKHKDAVALLIAEAVGT